jgi:hypothetical protein
MTIKLWLGLAVAAAGLELSTAALAATNVVPNPSFEEGGCGNTPILCGWAMTPDPNAYMYQDTDAYSGSASMALGWSGEIGGEFLNWRSAMAWTDPAYCAAIGPGVHPASFWFRSGDAAWVELGATFYQGADCSGATSSDSLGESPSGEGWQQLTGTLIAPAGTEAARFDVGVWQWCANYSGCAFSTKVDDLDVEDAVVTTPAISSFTPATGPVGASVDILGLNFTGATSVRY